MSVPLLGLAIPFQPSDGIACYKSARTTIVFGRYMKHPPSWLFVCLLCMNNCDAIISDETLSDLMSGTCLGRSGGLISHGDNIDWFTRDANSIASQR